MLSQLNTNTWLVVALETEVELTVVLELLNFDHIHQVHSCRRIYNRQVPHLVMIVRVIMVLLYHRYQVILRRLIEGEVVKLFVVLPDYLSMVHVRLLKNVFDDDLSLG